MEAGIIGRLGRLKVMFSPFVPDDTIILPESMRKELMDSQPKEKNETRPD